MALLGIDAGTSGCKTTILNEFGKVLSSAYREYPPTPCKVGCSEIAPENVWLSVAACIRESVAACPNDRVQALSISSFGEAAVPIDSAGRVLYNGILLTDPRGQEQMATLAERLGAQTLMQRTGVPLHPMYTIFRAMWLRDNQPEIFSRVVKFLQFEDYLIYKLSGEFATDYSLADRTMAFHAVDKVWDEEILAGANLSPDLFAHTLPSGTPVGLVQHTVAVELGLPNDTLVVTGGHDQPCAALGSGVISAGLAVDGMGTAECITTCLEKPVFSPELFASNYHCGPHVVPNRYITFAYTLSAGALLQWFRDTIGRSERAEAQACGMSAYALLDSRISPEPSGLLVLPHFGGSGTPYLDPNATGAILGLNSRTTTYDIYRAMLESITYEMRYNLECLEGAGIFVDSLRAVGGGAKSDVWLQIKADIMNRPVSTLAINEAGTLGVVMLAGIAAGIYRDADEACRLLVNEKHHFEPDPSRIERYEENYQRYKRLYPAVRDIWE